MADLNSRTYSKGNFAVTIGGSNVAFVKKFDGLSMEADIVSHDMGPMQYQAKNVANIKWTPGKVTIGTGMGNDMYQWMKSSLDCKFIQQNGSVMSADFNHNVQSELTFMNALMTKITLPKLDASSKEALYFDIEFDAEQVRWAKGGGKIDGSKYGVKQKAHLASNFRLDVPGLPCDRISTIDAITWTCSVTPDAIGGVREYTKHPAKIVMGDLKLSISMADYDPWAKKAKDWFVDGNHLDKDELDITITLLGPDMKLIVGTVDLLRCGFKKFTEGSREANAEGVARFDVELYVQQIALKLNEYDA
jgi:phage tail-like protein